MNDLDRAIGRATESWRTGLSHVDIEGAYLDRAILAAEVLRLRIKLSETTTALARAEADLDRAIDEPNPGF